MNTVRHILLTYMLDICIPTYEMNRLNTVRHILLLKFISARDALMKTLSYKLNDIESCSSLLVVIIIHVYIYIYIYIYIHTYILLCI